MDNTITLTINDADYICNEIRGLLKASEERTSKIESDIEEMKKRELSQYERMSALHKVLTDEEVSGEELKQTVIANAEKMLETSKSVSASFAKMIELLTSGSKIETIG